MQVKNTGGKLTLSTGEGRPWLSTLLIPGLVMTICAIVLVGHLYQAIVNGWQWGWLSAIIMPLILYGLGRTVLASHHAKLIVDPRFGRIEVDVATDSDGDKLYQPVLALKSGRRIELGVQSYRRAPLDEAARAFQAVAGLEIRH